MSRLSLGSLGARRVSLRQGGKRDGRVCVAVLLVAVLAKTVLL